MDNTAIASTDGFCGGEMMDGRYILVELPPGFSATNRRAAYDATTKNIGLHDTPKPNHNTHGRPSLDESDFIMEGIFTDGEIDRDAIAAMLAPELGLPVAAFNAMTVAIFPGDNWEERRQATVNFLIANNDDWNEEV